MKVMVKKEEKKKSTLRPSLRKKTKGAAVVVRDISLPFTERFSRMLTYKNLARLGNKKSIEKTTMIS